MVTVEDVQRSRQHAIECGKTWNKTNKESDWYKYYKAWEEYTKLDRRLAEQQLNEEE